MPTIICAGEGWWARREERAFAHPTLRPSYELEAINQPMNGNQMPEIRSFQPMLSSSALSSEKLREEPCSLMSSQT